MPKLENDCPAPLSFDGKSLLDIYGLLVEESERLAANARSISFYAIRSSMFGGAGSVAHSERTYIYVWLAEQVSVLASEIPPRTDPSKWTVETLAAEYRALGARARTDWERHGGVLLFSGSRRAHS